MSSLSPELAASLTDRYVTRFLAAWPEGGLTDAEVRSGVIIEEAITDRPGLAVTGYGGRAVTEWDGTIDDAEAIVEGVADLHAYDAEGDRWIMGAWREYRPEMPS